VSNVKTLPGVREHMNAVPNPNLIAALEDLVGMAKDGRLQSFIGTGFMADGARLATWFDLHDNVYEMLGSLAWLEHEYVARHTRE
jgi:hypothetical protein